MLSLAIDIVKAVIRLRREPGILAFFVLTLGAGIGVNTAVLTVAAEILITPFDLPGSNELLWVSQRNPRLGGGLSTVSPGGYLHLRESSRTIEPLAAFQPLELNITATDGTVVVNAARVTPSFFDVVAVRPEHGRPLLPDDAVFSGTGARTLGHTRIAVLSHHLWQSGFGADSTVIGTTVPVNGERYHVVGIMPAGFRFPLQTDVWLPLGFGAAAADDWGGFNLGVVGRLAPSANIEAAQRELNGIANELQEVVPRINDGLTYPVMTAKERLVSEIRPMLLVVVALAVTVLLLICANLAALMLARGIARTHEFAVRSALGAGRPAILRQLVAEALALSAPAGLVGLGFAALGLQVVQWIAPPELSAFWSLRLNGWSIAIALGLAVSTAIACACFPILQLTPSNLSRSLLESGPTASASRRKRRLYSTFVTGQFAFAFVLLAASGLLIRSYFELRGNELGFDPVGVLTAELVLPQERYPRQEDVVRFVGEIEHRLGSIPGTTAVAAAVRLPLVDRGGGVWFRLGTEPSSDDDPVSPEATFNAVTPDFFRTIGLPLELGSASEAGFTSETAIAWVSATFARRYLPGGAVGEHVILTPWPETPHRIVGVVRDVRQGGFRGDLAATIYVPFDQVTGLPIRRIHLLVRNSSDPGALAHMVRSRVLELDPYLAFRNVSTLEARLSNLLVPARMGTWLIAITGVLAMALAVAGVYSLTTVDVRQRTREAGIRIAMGARPRDVLWLLLRDSIVRVGFGLVMGAGLAVVLMRAGSAILFGVNPADPVVLIVTTTLLGGAALLAAYAPSRGLSQIDPALCFRSHRESP